MGETNNRSSILTNFFLDGAKIIFGSLVIGIFVPSATASPNPWITFTAGIMLTITFLFLAKVSAKNKYV